MHQLAQRAQQRSKRVADKLMQRNLQMACAESCTGGLLSKICTDVPGSSAWFDRAYITYSKTSKTQMLGVDADLIRQHGAVSEQVAAAMVQGVVQNSGVGLAASITGIAGPGGGTAEKPVGTVCFGFAFPGKAVTTSRMHFEGDRDHVRMQSVIYVFEHLLEMLN